MRPIYSQHKPPPLTDDERAAMVKSLARLTDWHGLVAKVRRVTWEGPWPRPIDLMSDQAYAAFLALPNVRSALDRTPPVPLRTPAPEMEKSA